MAMVRGPDAVTGGFPTRERSPPGDVNTLLNWVLDSRAHLGGPVSALLGEGVGADGTGPAGPGAGAAVVPGAARSGHAALHDLEGLPPHRTAGRGGASPQPERPRRPARGPPVLVRHHGGGAEADGAADPTGVDRDHRPPG